MSTAFSGLHIPFRLAGIDVEALSVGGLETCIELPGFDLCFDMGRCPPTAVRRRRVLVTHTHVDHAGALVTHASLRDLYGMPAPTYYVPRPNAEDLRQLFEVWRRLDRSGLPCTIEAVDPGVPFALGNERWGIPFRSPHRVFCQGYAVVSRRKKLRPEYVGLDAAALERLKREGAALSEEVEAVEVAFSGDATIDIVDQEPLVRAAKLLIIECTFVGDDVPPAKARAKGHLHLADLAERAHLLRNEHILLTHFSARYPRGAIREAVDRLLPPELRARVSLLPELVPDRPAR